MKWMEFKYMLGSFMRSQDPFLKRVLLTYTVKIFIENYEYCIKYYKRTNFYAFKKSH